MAAQGQTVFAASGDFGTQACLDLSSPESGLAVNDPASQPWVTGVGGTDLDDLGEPPLTAPTQTAWGARRRGVLRMAVVLASRPRGGQLVFERVSVWRQRRAVPGSPRRERGRRHLLRHVRIRSGDQARERRRRPPPRLL